MDLEDDYARAGFNGALPFGKRPALVIVDVVMAYLDPASPLYAGVEDALAANQRLLAAARAAGVPALFTNVVYHASGLDGGMFYRKVPALQAYHAGSPLGAFPPTLQPLPSEIVVSKQYASAFFGTALASTLHAMGIDTVMLTGFSTSGCVRASALDALQHGFAPFVVREACGDRAAGPHEASLFDLQAKYAEVIGEDEAIRLLQAAG
ncbi:isochorismatase family protein [Sphingomonas immobilis]|uniref:Isochorismatase family protein n=1 Tax=Sphingomonas immobilis TaxID=3063997 RepID=A0ABT9A3T6_9SPHN|nr:isochorismatase family protein [Sphingomonas sp. CA1-15]MDO7843397.1 isochorismatase family protein [Sphingomonas sp. CA1-15]